MATERRPSRADGRDGGRRRPAAQADGGVAVARTSASDPDLVRELLDELEETNQAVLRLTMELDARVEERTRALHEAQEELELTNSELLQLTLELQDRVAERTAQLEEANASLRASERDARDLAEAAVAARARAEEANVLLRESEEKYRIVTENAVDVIWTVDLRTSRFTYVSPSVTRLTGRTPEEMMAGAAADMLTPASAEAMVTFARDQLAVIRGGGGPGRPVTIEVDQTRMDGSVVSTEVVLTVLVEDEIPLLLGVSRDITERKRAEEALRVRAARDALLVDQSADAILRYLPPRGRIVDANPAACELFGYPPGELLDLDLVDLLDVDPPLSALPHTPEALGERTGEAEWTVRRADDSRILVSARIRALPDGTLLTLARDVTAERERESRAAEAQRMEAIGRLAGGIAHDFNNLLTVVNGEAELLALELPGDDPRAQDAAAIHEAGSRAAALVRQLLAFSRRQVLKPVVLNLDDVVIDLAPMLGRLVGEAIALDLSTRAPDGNVRVDRAQLEQVVMNLVVNARDAMPDGGRIAIETTVVEVPAGDARLRGSAGAGSYIRLVVADTGIGMDAATLGRVFEPFFTTKAATKGTGLGLATVYGIVGASGGFIDVASELGSGSTFAIHLPRVLEAAASAQAAHDAPPPAGGETILLVEDEPAVRHVTARMLLDLGYSVIEAADGRAALAAAAEAGERLDLVITDVVMPGMSGPDLAAELVAARPGLRTLFMSGYAPDTLLRPDALDEHCAFIAKPVDRATLGRRVREVLEGRPG